MRSIRPLLLVPLAAVFILASAGCLGLAGDSSTDLSELEDVLRQLEQDYIDQERLNEDALNRAAIRGVLDYLDDPYTSYLAPAEYERIDFSGEAEEFEGIGAEVTTRDDEVIIIGPLPGSPASEAGIQPGDVVLEVDGESVEGMGLMETVALIRGPKGTEVTLTVLRAGDLEPVEITVTRDTIMLTSVSARIQAEDIGYVRLHAFDEQTADRMREAVVGLREEGAQGIVLDLRNNSGGLLDSAVAVVSEFVEDGDAAIWRDAEEERGLEVSGEGELYDVPVVVLVNSFTASAAEIVTGALQDHDRAIAVGTRTFGKGSVNLLSRLDSGAGLYVTAAHWLTPDGRLIEGEGLEPDVVVGEGLDVQAAQRISSQTRRLCETYQADAAALESQEEFRSALEQLCNMEGEPPAPVPTDEQLDAGMEQLRQLIAERG